MADPELSDDEVAISELFCPACGYNLHGLVSDRCPECGLSIDLETLNRSVIPWTHRERIGRIRAFGRTVMLAARSPRTLAQDASRPVSYCDAQLFRWTVVLLAAFPLMVAAIVIRAWGGSDIAAAPMRGAFTSGWPPVRLSAWIDVAYCLLAGATVYPVPPVALLLFFG